VDRPRGNGVVSEVVLGVVVSGVWGVPGRPPTKGSIAKARPGWDWAAIGGGKLYPPDGLPD